MVRMFKNGLVLGESPRWHDGRLWLADWGAGQILAVDLDGGSEVVLELSGMPVCFDWLPDGRLLVVSGREGLLLRREADGELVVHADLTALADPPWNDIVVDGRGNAYVGATGFDFPGGEFAPGILALVSPDGQARQVAEGVAFPNGVAVTPDNGTLILAESYGKRLTGYDIGADGSLSNRRVYCQIAPTVPLEQIAEDYSNVPYGPDGCTLDAEGCVWAGNSLGDWLGRFSPEGEVLDRIDAPEAGMATYAVQLGGIDGKTLLMCVAPDWRIGMGDSDRDARASLWTVKVDGPHHGGRP